MPQRNQPVQKECFFEVSVAILVVHQEFIKKYKLSHQNESAMNTDKELPVCLLSDLMCAYEYLQHSWKLQLACVRQFSVVEYLSQNQIILLPFSFLSTQSC